MMAAPSTLLIPRWIAPVKGKQRNIILALSLILNSSILHAQDTIKFETIKSIKDIPHATLKQKWMWIHRSIAFAFLKKHAPTHDTSYYACYKSKLVITLPLSTRFINFELKDGISANSLKFQPNNQYDFGLCINSKFASFLMNTGVALFTNDEGIKGKTKYSDYQFNIYGKKSTVDFSLQTYKGFYVENSGKYSDFNNSQKQLYEVRPDVAVYALSFNHYYLFNNKKFSYRSSFAFTEHQKKSAGSLLCGGYLSLFGIKADSALVSKSFAQYFTTNSNVTSASIFNFGYNVGYIYTLVIKKKLRITLSLVQGIGTNKTTIMREDASKEESDFKFSSKQNLRMALGYDNGVFFYGVMGMYDFYNFDDKTKSTLDYSYGKFRTFVGYRFSSEKRERKLLRKLNLIDYRL